MWLYVVYTGTAVGRGWKMDFSRAFKKTCNDLKCGGKGTQWIYEFQDKNDKNNKLGNLKYGLIVHTSFEERKSINLILEICHMCFRYY